MSELTVIETGEVVESMTRIEAERITARIADKLDAIADNLEQVMPMIREALTREAWKALGYASPTAYVSERFAGALARLPRNVRQPVVCELSAAGMSTRAISPIVGASQMQVVRDVAAGETFASPEPEWKSAGETLRTAEQDGDTPDLDDNEQAAVDTGATVTKTTVTKITGLDGKAYAKPEPSKPRRRPLPDAARDAGWDLRKAVEKAERITKDDRFKANKDEVAAHLRSHLTQAVEVCQDLLDRIN